MTLRQQFERVLRATLLVFVLAAAGFLSAVTAIRIGIRGRIVAMPNLVGQPVTEAQRALAAKGLQLRIADRVYSPFPVNTVARQSPPAGEQVKVSQDAHVVLSLGPQTVRVPPLEGFSIRAGRIALLQAGLAARRSFHGLHARNRTRHRAQTGSRSRHRSGAARGRSPGLPRGPADLLHYALPGRPRSAGGPAHPGRSRASRHFRDAHRASRRPEGDGYRANPGTRVTYFR